MSEAAIDEILGVVLDGLAKNGSRTNRCAYLTRSEREALHERMVILAGEHRPLTLRQLYYLLVSEGSVEKTTAGYRRVMRQLKVLRRDRQIDWRWVIDNSRWVRGADSYRDLSDFLDASARLYRKSLWADVPERVEIWCESDSISGPIGAAAEPWDVRVYPTSGYSSDGFLYPAANNIAYSYEATFIYYFGDYDPSGKDISRDLEEKLRTYAVEFGAEPEALIFERMAVTQEQIEEHQLPTRPAKKSDPRAKYWEGGVVEIEALPPDVLKQIVESCILQHLDAEAVERLRAVEEAERDTLAEYAERQATES